MSIPYLVSAAISDRQVSLPQFTAEKLAAPDVAALQDRVEMILDPELDAMAPKHLPARVVIVTRDGRTLSEQVVAAKGDPDNPLTDDETAEKFRKLSAGILTDAAIDDVIGIVGRLEQVDDLRELTTALRDIQR